MSDPVYQQNERVVEDISPKVLSISKSYAPRKSLNGIKKKKSKSMVLVLRTMGTTGNNTYANETIQGRIWLPNESYMVLHKAFRVQRKGKLPHAMVI